MGTVAEEPPEGVFPFFILDSSAEKLGLRIGEENNDSVRRKSFKTEEILEEIKKYCFMCPFEPCKNLLEKCGLDQVVVVYDATSKYGETFLLLYTEESIVHFEPPSQSTKPEESLSQSRQVEFERKEINQPEDNVPVMYSYNPLIPRLYASASISETENEIALMNSRIEENQELPETIMRRKLSFPRKKVEPNFQDDRILITKIPKSSADGLKITPCFVRDAFCQVPTDPSVERGMQTNWRRKVNKIIQYEPLILDACGIHYVDVLDDVCKFLRVVLPRFEDSLQQNETVDIYADYFDFGAESELPSSFVHNEEYSMKERSNFTDLDFSKGRYISAIDTHPNGSIIAVSVCEPGPQHNHVTCKSSFIIMWNLNHPLHPQMILKSTLDCPVFRFNPSSPEVIVGGSVGGQVIMWKTDHVASKASKQNDEQEQLILEPIATSVPDHSHKQMIADISWLPPHIQINAKGLILSKEHLSETSNQFLTISGDGSILFWDIRYCEILKGKLPHIAKVKGDKKSLQALNKWTPLFRIKPKRLIGTGELSFCKTFVPSTNKSGRVQNSSSVLVCASEEGEILQVDWSPKPQEAPKEAEKESDYASPDEYVLWMKKDHNRPCVALSQNCEFPFFVLSASDWNFRVWEISSESASLVFTSPNASCQITDGIWSPTRPSVLFIAKSNGYVDVWDFTDSCYAPCYSFSLTPNRINSIHMIQNDGGDEQFLAIGDNIGTLHLFDVPRNLVKPFEIESDFVLNLFEKASEAQVQSVEEKRGNSNDIIEEQDDGAEADVVETVDNNDVGLSEEEEALFLKLQSDFLTS